MNSNLRPTLIRYGWALIAALSALGLRLTLDPLLGNLSPHATFYLAILFTAGFCGTAPAMLVMAFGALAAAYFIIPPRGSLALESVEFATGMVLYLFVALTIIILYRLLQIAQGQLLAKHRQLELDEELTRHTLDLLERERKIVAYEIHDGLIQYATAALMHVEAIRDQGLASADDPKLTLAYELLRRAIEEGRRLINGIRPLVLDRFGLVAAVKSLSENTRGS